MFRTYLLLQPGVFDAAKSRIFIPELASCNLHSVQFDIAGAVGQFEGMDFDIEPPFIMLKQFLGDPLTSDSNFVARIDYHDLPPAANFSQLAQDIVGATLGQHQRPRRTVRLISGLKYLLSTFHILKISLDIGLYKEALNNYGAVLEALLNLDRRHITLSPLITGSSYDQLSKDLMSDIQHLRNRDHPERLDSFKT